jgi:hypothetical protein
MYISWVYVAEGMAACAGECMSSLPHCVPCHQWSLVVLAPPHDARDLCGVRSAPDGLRLPERARYKDVVQSLSTSTCTRPKKLSLHHMSLRLYQSNTNLMAATSISKEEHCRWYRRDSVVILTIDSANMGSIVRHSTCQTALDLEHEW